MAAFKYLDADKLAKMTIGEIKKYTKRKEAFEKAETERKKVLEAAKPKKTTTAKKRR